MKVVQVRDHDRLAGCALSGGKPALGLLVVVIACFARGLTYADLVERSGQREMTESLTRVRPDQ
jgi:hypothetical protein